MKGIAYGVGVGPGDPELITLKAVRLMRENSVIAFPGENAEKSLAFQIALKSVPELAEKTLLAIDMPMTRDAEILREAHKKGAVMIERYLDIGKNVVYLTLGDPTVYSSFVYLSRILEKDGYSTRFISGITSFCAAASRLNICLSENDEQIHIVTGKNAQCDDKGTYVLLKSGKEYRNIKQRFIEKNYSLCAVENCGLENEKIYTNYEDIPENMGYLTIIIAKYNEEKREERCNGICNT